MTPTCSAPVVRSPRWRHVGSELLEGIKVAVARRKKIAGLSPTNRRPCLAFEVMGLRTALEGKHDCDAHLVAYIVDGQRRQPRVNKKGLPLLASEPLVGVIFCDVDNPGHAAWNAEDLAKLPLLYRTLPILRTAGLYDTKHGFRIVQPLSVPVPVSQIEPIIMEWFHRLELAGLAVDHRCYDWTRMFRLPRVVRDGERSHAQHLLLDQMVAVPVNVVAPDGTVVVRRHAAHTREHKTLAYRSNGRRYCTGAATFREHIAILQRDGISREGTFHETQRDLAFSLWREGVPEEQCEEWVLEYLLGGRFNHRSTTIRDSPERVRAEVSATIRSMYSSSPRPSAPARRRALSRREWLYVLETTCSLDGLERYRQLQFLFDLVAEFKTFGRRELELPRDRIRGFLGAQSGTYQRRLVFALESGLLVECGEQPRPGKCRCFRLSLELDDVEDYATVDEALVDSGIGFLSRHMQILVRRNVANRHDASWARSVRRINGSSGSSGCRAAVSRSSAKRSRSGNERSTVRMTELELGDPNQGLDELSGTASAEDTLGQDDGRSDDAGVSEPTASGPSGEPPPPCLALLRADATQALDAWDANTGPRAVRSPNCCPAAKSGNIVECMILNVVMCYATSVCDPEPVVADTDEARAGP